MVHMFAFDAVQVPANVQFLDALVFTDSCHYRPKLSLQAFKENKHKHRLCKYQYGTDLYTLIKKSTSIDLYFYNLRTQATLLMY